MYTSFLLSLGSPKDPSSNTCRFSLLISQAEHAKRLSLISTRSAKSKIVRLGASWSWNAGCGLEGGGYFIETPMGESTFTHRFFCCLWKFWYTGRGGRFTTEKDLTPGGPVERPNVMRRILSASKGRSTVIQY